MTTPAEKDSSKINVVRWAIGLPVGFFALLMLVSKILFTASPDTEAQWVERETIRQCWKELKRKPDDDKPLHFKGKEDCERLEFDFKARWNTNP
ncbi:Uncharacterised protein [uncultured Comamonas sp.]|nr:Uncharacterised protein [uncultured Comamonas sp.]